MEVAYLILNGSLPNREELAEFETLVKEARHLPGYSCEILVLIKTGEKDIKIFDLAKFYGENTGGFIIIGDANYGEGSSREHAAISPGFMGARAVITRSFARIHEANLKKQGILPLTFSDPHDYDKIKEYNRISIVNLAKLQPGKPVKTVIKRRDEITSEMYLNHTLTEEQIEWFKAGSALNTISDVSLTFDDKNGFSSRQYSPRLEYYLDHFLLSWIMVGRVHQKVAVPIYFPVDD